MLAPLRDILGVNGIMFRSLRVSRLSGRPSSGGQMIVPEDVVDVTKQYGLRKL